MKIKQTNERRSIFFSPADKSIEAEIELMFQKEKNKWTYKDHSLENSNLENPLTIKDFLVEALGRVEPILAELNSEGK